MFSGGWIYRYAARDDGERQVVPPAPLAAAVQPAAADAPGMEAVAPPAARAADLPPRLPADALSQQAPGGPALEPEIREALKGILNTSSEGLVIEERNGTRSINLQGRFRTAPVATIDEQGEAQITDYSWLPAE